MRNWAQSAARRIELIRTRSPEKALKYSRWAVGRCPDPESKCSILIAYGLACVRAGNFDEARSALARAERLVARHALSHLAVDVALKRAGILLESGNAEEALNRLNQALHLAPLSESSLGRILVTAGVALQLSGRTDEAAKFFELGLTTLPSTELRPRASAFLQLASIAESKGDFETAYHWLVRASNTLPPESAATSKLWWRLGSIKQAMGHHGEAIEAFRTARKTFPNDCPHDHALLDLSEAMSHFQINDFQSGEALLRSAIAFLERAENTPIAKEIASLAHKVAQFSHFAESAAQTLTNICAAQIRSPIG